MSRADDPLGLAADRPLKKKLKSGKRGLSESDTKSIDLCRIIDIRYNSADSIPTSIHVCT